MLFHNCADRNLNLDLTASLPFAQTTLFARHSGLYKDPCRIISKLVDFDEPTESDRYIGDLSIDEDLEKEIEVGFFEALKTPSEELKGFTPIDESNPLVSGIIAAVAAHNNSISAANSFDTDVFTERTSVNVSSARPSSSLSSSSPSQSLSPSPSPAASSIITDIEMADGRKNSLQLPHHLSHLQVKQSSSTDSLMTPIIDPNSALNNSGPHFPSFDVNADNVFGQYLQELAVSCENDSNQQLQEQDIKPNFSLAPSPLTFTGSGRQQHQPMHQQHHPQHHHLEQSSLSASNPLHHNPQNQQQTTEPSLDSHRPSSHSYSLGSSAAAQHDFEYPTTLPGISGYSNRSVVCDVDPSIGIGTPASLTPSSSTSSMSYAELKPRSYSFSHSQPSTSQSTDNLVPTVVEDHPYTSRHNTASPFGNQRSFSPPSSCPSTSSLGSNTDQRDNSRDFHHLISGSDYPSSNSKRNPGHHRESSSRRGRLTKKEKLDKMVSEEQRLETENSALREQLRVMQHQFKILQTRITDILVDAAKRKS